jgi:hypothetical protein
MRLPLAPLLEQTGNALALSRTLRAHPRQVQRWRRDGIPVFSADQAAVQLGFHPAELWPEWWDLDLPACGVCRMAFAPESACELYCSVECKRVAQASSRRRRRERMKARAV